MSPPTDYVPVYDPPTEHISECHPQQNMSKYHSDRTYPWMLPTTEHDSVTPIHVPEFYPWQNLSFFPCCHTLKEPVSVSWVSSNRMYLFVSWVSAHNRVCLCLLGVPSRKKKKVICWISSPERTCPCFLCVCHLIAHGPGSWLACFACFIIYYYYYSQRDTEFYLPTISKS